MRYVAPPTFEQRKLITLMKQGQNTHQNRENEVKDTKNYAGGEKMELNPWLQQRKV